jgi:hypothetical protein
MAPLAPRLLGPAATTSTAIRHRPVTTWVRAHPVAAYLAWMLTVGWAFTLFPTLAKKTLDIDLPLQPFILVSTWLGMLLPALVITGIVDGSQAVRGLLARALPPRTGIGWYAVALIAVPVTAVGLAALAFGPPLGYCRRRLQLAARTPARDDGIQPAPGGDLRGRAALALMVLPSVLGGSDGNAHAPDCRHRVPVDRERSRRTDLDRRANSAAGAGHRDRSRCVAIRDRS